MSISIKPVRLGLILGILATLFGMMWAVYLATQHESLHGAFVSAMETGQDVETGMDMDDMSLDHHAGSAGNHHGGEDHSQKDGHHASKPVAAGHHAAGAKGQHSHTGNLANDAMQRLLRGHVHWMGVGVMAMALILILGTSSLKNGWKTVLSLGLGTGALFYPPAWILMGFRTVALGPEGAEQSVSWLFIPAAGTMFLATAGVLAVLLIEVCACQRCCGRLFEEKKKD